MLLLGNREQITVKSKIMAQFLSRWHLCGIALFLSLATSNSGVLAEIQEACPTIFCPWNCDRYIDASGCIFCGKCSPQPACPEINCPSLPYFQCLPRQGRDGCTVCKCRIRSPRPQSGATSTVASELAALKQQPRAESTTTRAPLAANEPVIAPNRKDAESIFNQRVNHQVNQQVVPIRNTCRSMPLCGQNCRIQNDGTGCPKCDCMQRRDCSEPANAPCRRPDCRRQLGPDGCYHCQCPDDIAVCREVKCFKPCVPLIDYTSGCATGCRCPNDVKP